MFHALRTLLKVQLPEKLFFFLEKRLSGIQEKIQLKRIQELFFRSLNRTRLPDGQILLFRKGNSLKIYACDFPSPFERLNNVYQGLEIPLSQSSALHQCVTEKLRVILDQQVISDSEETRSDLLLFRFHLLKAAQMIYFPLGRKKSAPLGVLLVFKLFRPLSPSQCTLIQRLSRRFLPALEKSFEKFQEKEEKEDLARSLEKYKSLLNFTNRINVFSAQENLYETLIQELMTLYGFDLGVVHLEKKGLLPMVTGDARLGYRRILLEEIRHFGNPANAPDIHAQDSSSAMVFSSNTPLYFYDVDAVSSMPMKPKSKKAMEIAEKRIKTMLQIPLRRKNRPLGVLQLWSFEKNITLKETDIGLIIQILSFIPSVIRNSDLFFTAESQKQELETKNLQLAKKNTQITEQNWFLGQIYDLSRMVNASLNFNQVLKILIRNLRLIFGFEMISVFLVNREKQLLIPARIDILGLTEEEVKGFYEKPFTVNLKSQETWSRAIQEKRSLFSHQPASFTPPSDHFALFTPRTLLIVPLMIQDEVMGLIHLGNHTEVKNMDEEEMVRVETYVSIISTAVNNAKIYEELLKEKRIIESYNTKIREELGLARKIQTGLIPRKLPETKRFSFSALYQPMEEIGGDFYDFIPLQDQRVGIFISDVAGHGVPAALITSMVKSLIDTAPEEVRESPGNFFRFLNQGLMGKLNENFLTAFYGIYDPVNHSFTYSRAGHTYPLLLRKGKISELKSRGMLLGVFEPMETEEANIVTEPGDRLIFYTDGVTECFNAENIRFDQTFHTLLEQNGHLKVDALMDTVHRSILEHRKDEFFSDDLCLIAMEIKE